MLVRRGIEQGAEEIVKYIAPSLSPLRVRGDCADCYISAADEQIGQLIAEVMDKVGKDGVITVEESRGTDFETDYVEGMQFDRGYVSPYSSQSRTHGSLD